MLVVGRGYFTLSRPLRIVSHIDRRTFQAVKSQHMFQVAVLVLRCEVRIFISVYKIKANHGVEFFIFCWPCISLQIIANNQLDALFHVFIYFISLHVSSITLLIIRRSNFTNTSSGMIILCKRLLGMPVRHIKQSLTLTNHTSWCINTIRSPGDEQCYARNM